MGNFNYLNKHDYYNSFTGACIEAEKSFAFSYASTAILARRALELAVKWLYSYDNELKLPYQDNLSSLIHDYSFRDLIDMRLFRGLKYIKDLGNKAVHTTSPVKKEQAVYSLKCLHDFTSWIDYCYSDSCTDTPFNETILPDGIQEKRTRRQLLELNEELGSKDRKLEEIRKENEELRKQLTAKREDNEQGRVFDVEEISEFETRRMFIDLELETSGWTIGSACIIEEEVSGMPNDTGLGFVDYVLYGDDGKPLALVEAKKTSADPHVGKEQARFYADCLEKRYGRRPVIFYTNGFEYFLWDDQSYPERRVSGIYTKEDLQWTHYRRTNRKSLKSISINDAVTNRAYQKMAIQAVCDTFEKGHRKALLVMATGSGKTRTAISLVDVLLRQGWVKNILFLADRRELVKQAKVNFSNLLPNLSLCNLLDEKDSPESKMIFSTYPTMMNAIDETKRKDGSRLFTVGHFDLIIVDESHRSIYKKYQAIFDYFDSSLVGLTATPKNDIDKNTYTVFDLENNVPTFAYELGEAIEEGFLVPYHTIETRLKLPEEGLHYEDLSDEEKELFEETFDDDVTDISGEEINSFLFNNDTVDLVIDDLMERGIKIEGGDKLGKTIVFAKNKKHAEFIIKRFNIKYPEYRDLFAKPIYTDIKYVDRVYEDFTTKDKFPQIAVSVDMLDTGVDVPEIVNLVFFKKVRSKAKFHQMIGRGTRLCPDLFGVGLDKDGFRIFDYCSNFEFFRENKHGKEASMARSLTENLFCIRTDIIKELQTLDYQTDDYIAYHKSLADDLWGSVNRIDHSRFNAKTRLKYINTFNKRDRWNTLSDTDTRELSIHIAPLITSTDDDELAKRFDYLMYTIIYAQITGRIASKPRARVISTADHLSRKGTVNAVKAREEIIRKVQTEEYWQNADILDHEEVRRALRELIKFIEYESKKTYYSNFRDEVLEVHENEGEYSAGEFKDYRKKVNDYLKKHADDIVVFKLRNNHKLTQPDIKHLEDLLWNTLGSKEDYENAFGEQPLLDLVIRIVGLEPEAANEQFSKFLSNESLNSNQMEFVKMIVRHIIQNGLVEKELLNGQPFNKYGNIIDLFAGHMDIAKDLVAEIDRFNSRADVS